MKEYYRIFKSLKLQYQTLIVPLFLILILVFSGCATTKKIKIAFSKASGSAGYEAYVNWVKSYDKNIECIDLYKMDYNDAIISLDECSGLILTGGPDVHPDRYGKIEDTSRCEIDNKRDTLEFALIKKALDMDLPILAICRGEQILNVAKGGTLIVDIPSDYDTTVKHRCPYANNCNHEVNIVQGSLLASISNVTISIVNSNHHQAVDRLANDFVATAKSDDGIIEAYEYKNSFSMPFLIAIQWHPERLSEKHPLSKPLLESFLKSARNFRKYVSK